MEPNLKHKLRSSLCCCFPSVNEYEKPTLPHSTSTSSSLHELPLFKDKCRNLLSRFGRGKRRCSGDFKYDPLSYALNFDEGPLEFGDEEGDESGFSRNFSARLPASPPLESASVVKVSALS